MCSYINIDAEVFNNSARSKNENYFTLFSPHIAFRIGLKRMLHLASRFIIIGMALHIGEKVFEFLQLYSAILTWHAGLYYSIPEELAEKFRKAFKEMHDLCMKVILN